MSDSLRDRTRRAVRAELSDAAQELFLTQGYESTTVEQIAAAAGMSRRSFFRYFASKEELVIGKFETSNADMLRILLARPADEPLWTSLRAVFEVAVSHQDDAHLRARSTRLQEIVDASPELRGAQMATFAVLQDELCAVAISRGATDRLATGALVSAAFACLQTAMSDAYGPGGSGSLAASLDRAMSAVRAL